MEIHRGPAGASTSSSAKETGDAEKNPAISSPRWEDASGQAITKALVGDEVYLCAHVTDITDGAAATIKIVEKDADAIDDEVATLPEYAFTVEVRLVRPEITKAQWQDAEGSVTGRGLVERPLRLVAETRDMEGGVTFHVRDGEGQEVASLGADIVEGRAEAQWTPADPRKPDDTRELRYRLQVTGSRCRKAAGGEVQVRNPRVVSMEWDRKAIYYGEKATLRIKTLEVAQESPTCRLQLWERDYTTADDLLLERDITIDGDEVETEIECNFDVERVLDEEVDGELEIFCRLIYNGTDMAGRIHTRLLVRTQGGRR